MLAELASYVGDYDTASDHLERAVKLIDRSPASWAKAFVLSRAARLKLLRASLDAAIALGEQALEIATSLSLDEIRVHALNTVGTARVEQNDVAGRGDLKGSLADTARSVMRARQVKDAQNLCPTLAIRAFVLLATGDPDSARELAREVVDGWQGVENVVLTWGGVGAVAALATLGDGPLFALEAERSSRGPWLA